MACARYVLLLVGFVLRLRKRFVETVAFPFLHKRLSHKGTVSRSESTKQNRDLLALGVGITLEDVDDDDALSFGAEYGFVDVSCDGKYDHACLYMSLFAPKSIIIYKLARLMIIC